MPVVNRIADFHEEMTEWRRDLHAHPELGYEEHRTSEFVARKLAEYGIEVHRGLAGTGVVGTLRGTGIGSGSIGLRADMDALSMQEENQFPHASRYPGRMHACGHDGHTTMLLGAARYLAETKRFRGTVHFIFQPAEEGLAGGRKMVEQGLFEQFPCDSVFALHNWPDLPTGTAGVRTGPVMAAADRFEITLTGKGCHAAMPHQGVDPVLAGAHLITALQSLVSRTIDPLDRAVVSVTQMHTGSAFNVIPEEARLSGTVRTFKPETQARLETLMARMTQSIADAFGASAELSYAYGYPVTTNTPDATETAARVAAEILGALSVNRDADPCMGAEDFSFMLQKRPGCYILVGQGGGPHGCAVHNPRYDFNDEILPIGSSLFARLVETQLGAP